jgi:hypothetical protein
MPTKHIKPERSIVIVCTIYQQYFFKIKKSGTRICVCAQTLFPKLSNNLILLADSL